MPKKAATPKKASTKASSKKDEKKSVHQQFADIVANVDVGKFTVQISTHLISRLLFQCLFDVGWQLCILLIFCL